MRQQFAQKASMPNPALAPFGVLIGTWSTSGRHGLLADTVLHGHVSFEWLENGAFLMQRSEIDDLRFPSTLSIIGSDDSENEYYMLTFDERGISRKHEMTLQGNLWKWWRNAPGFFQRYQGTILEDGNTIIGKGELSRDGLTWEQDLDLTYTRVE